MFIHDKLTIAFDPETKTLLGRFLDLLEGKGQADVAAATAAVQAVTSGLRVSASGLKPAIDKQPQ